MAHVAAAVDLAAPPEEVWELIGGFDSIPDWLPEVSQSVSSKGGRLRTLTLGSGTVVEELVAFDAEARRYSYRILDGKLPVVDYLATLEVSPAAGGSNVSWTASFEPGGVAEAEAVQLITAVFNGGLGKLVERYGALPRN